MQAEGRAAHQGGYPRSLGLKMVGSQASLPTRAGLKLRPLSLWQLWWAGGGSSLSSPLPTSPPPPLLHSLSIHCKFYFLFIVHWYVCAWATAHGGRRTTFRNGFSLTFYHMGPGDETLVVWLGSIVSVFTCRGIFLAPTGFLMCPPALKPSGICTKHFRLCPVVLSG